MLTWNHRLFVVEGFVQGLCTHTIPAAMLDLCWNQNRWRKAPSLEVGWAQPESNIWFQSPVSTPLRGSITIQCFVVKVGDPGSPISCWRIQEYGIRNVAFLLGVRPKLMHDFSMTCRGVTGTNFLPNLNLSTVFCAIQFFSITNPMFEHDYPHLPLVPECARLQFISWRGNSASLI